MAEAGEHAAPGPSEAGRAESGPVIERWAWAKVNLYLHVVGRRADGYHELDSLAVMAGVGDRLTFRPAEALTLDVRGPRAEAIPGDGDNLVLRAARALAEETGVPPRADIVLDKTLPVAAGIGGGSSDCAVALEGLTALWSLPDVPRRLRRLAAGLGADVPVCLYGKPAYLGGIGEDLERAPALPPVWLALANPGIALGTPAVFEARQGSFSDSARWRDALPDAETLAARLGGTRNDLEAPAIALVPAIGELIETLAALPGALLARMSGSGATCFALFAARGDAVAAAEALRVRHPYYWTAVAPLLHGKLARPWWPEA